MRATLTQLRREIGKVLSAMLHRKKTVHLTQHGTVVADLSPRTQPMTGEEFARLWRDRRPLDKATAEEVLNNIRETRRHVGLRKTVHGDTVDSSAVHR